MVAAILTSQTALAQSRLNSFFPFALQRGQTAEVTFHGERLQSAHPIISYTPGLSHGEWEISQDGKQAKTAVAIPAGFPLGWHALRLCTPAGFTDMRTFYVSDAVLVKEANQPHGLDSPQEIEHATLLRGRLQRNNTLDCYAIALAKGDLLSAEVQALRAGRAMFDVKLLVLGPDGTTVAECDDTNITKQDPYVRLIAAQTGDYRLVIQETRFEGKGNYWYLLHTGKFPRPAVARQLGGQTGSKLEVTWLNDDGSSFEQTVRLPDEISDNFAVFPQDEHGVAPSPAHFRVNDLAVVAELEPNDGLKRPQELELPVAVDAAIEKTRDADVYRFTAKQGQVVRCRVHARNTGRSPLDPIMSLKHASGKFIASNDDIRGMPDCAIEMTAPADDQYVVTVRDQRHRGGSNFVYRLEIDVPQPQLTLDIPHVARNQSAVLTVPQGNRMAFLITAARQNVGGAITVELPELPAGLSAEHQQLPAGRYRLPVLLTASEEAAEGGHLLPIQGVIENQNQTVRGEFKLRQPLVTGRNNREMWGVTVDRLATAITPPAPVTIELVEPQVPLVRSGTMDLKIVAQRQEGFAAPIRLRMLYNPAGVSSRDTATIAENAQATTLTLTANAKAAVGDWPIVIVAETEHEAKRQQFSTQVCSLTVAEQFFELKFPQANIERGTSAKFTVGVNYKREFSEHATAQLVGLPSGVTAEPVQFGHGDKTLEFDITAAENAPLGRHGGVTCRVTIVQDGEPITHVLGAARLRVDKPLDGGLTAIK